MKHAQDKNHRIGFAPLAAVLAILWWGAALAEPGEQSADATVAMDQGGTEAVADELCETFDCMTFEPLLIDVPVPQLEVQGGE